MGNKERIIVCADDIRPETVDKYFRYWYQLKSDHSGLKLNAFVIPYYFKEESESILNKEFVEWFTSVKDWVQLHLHGYTHSFPPECLAPKLQQEEYIEKGARLLSLLCHRDFGFKAPGYHYNDDTIEILKRYRITFLCNEKEIVWLRNKIGSDLSQPELIQSHTNGLSVDSVEKIYDKLNELFKDKEFLFLNDL